MDRHAMFRRFKALHEGEQPFGLCNIWDVGSAIALAEAGAPAVATSSWSVAAVRGHADGEALPFCELLDLTRALAKAVGVPVSIDFEAGYAASLEDLSANASALAAAGAVGVNFEDAAPKSGALLTITNQVARIKAVKAAAPGGLFVNARTDLFLKEPDPTRHGALVDAALERIRAYAEAGADGFFIPGTQDPSIIAAICKASPLPVNVMSDLTTMTLGELAELGVKRVSAGPAPWFAFTSWLANEAKRYQ